MAVRFQLVTARGFPNLAAWGSGPAAGARWTTTGGTSASARQTWASHLVPGSTRGHISVGAGRAAPIETRRERVDAEAKRLVGLGASFVRALSEEGVDH